MGDGEEPVEAAWDAVGQLGNAILEGREIAMISLGSNRLFDSFDPAFICEMLEFMGAPTEVVETWRHLQINTNRRIEFGDSCGDEFEVTSGIVQGDRLPIIPAILLVSRQFRVVSAVHGPTIKMGACIDDRSYTGPCEELLGVYDTAEEFDRGAGHSIQQEKTTIHATNKKDANKAKQLEWNGRQIRVNGSEVLVGEPVDLWYRNDSSNTTNRVYKAISYAIKASAMPIGKHKRTKLVAVSVAPTLTYTSLWSTPTQRSVNKPRTSIVKSIFGKSSLLRAPEVSLAVLSDPRKVDTSTAMCVHTTCTARRIIIEDKDRYNEFCASPAIIRRKVSDQQ